MFALLIEPYKDVSQRRAQEVGRTRPLELNIRPYGDILITSAGDVLRTSVGDVPWRYKEDHMGMSIGRLLGTLSGLNFAEWIRVR